MLLSRKQLWHGHIQCGSQYFEGAQCDIAFAAFNRPDVSAMQSARVSKLLLRNPELFSMCADVVGENLPELGSWFAHCKHPRLLRTSCELADDESTDYK